MNGTISAEPLRVLFVEDSESDAKLILNALRKTGRTVEHERVEDEAAMRAAVDRRPWDIILSDWSLPRFSGLNALAVAKEVRPDLPFILVSGTIGEETAVEAMRAGAHDYVLKDKLARLLPAVERELRDSEARRQRRRTEEALRISEARFRRLAESGIVGISIADVFGHVHDANQAYLDMVGYSREEMLQNVVPWLEMTPLEWKLSDAAAVERLQTNAIAPIYEKELVRRDGSRLPVLVGAAMLEHPMCIGFVADLSQRKHAEEALAATTEQLRQAQKMEAVGRLAGGVAHDFNNLLFVILTCAEILRADLASGDPLRGDAEEICKAAERAAGLTRQLLMFSRQQVMAPRVIDLNVVIGGMHEMLKRLVGEDVEVKVVAGHSLGNVKADVGSVEQVILNLVVNARDAMPTGGSITIATDNATLDDSVDSSHVGVTAGPHVMFAVTDTGIGMSKETQARIFEPFFTTKEKDKGTGLGLSTAFGIIQQSGGSISVQSEPGHGTTFKVYLPQVDEVAMSAQPSTALPVVQGTETILLVEDEAQVRLAARNVLQRNGYHVLEASNGADALRICENGAQPLDLLLTDVVMPKMSGPELARRLVALRPEVRVLFMSGYTDDSIFRHGVLEAEIAYLEKPMTPDSIAKKVREVLDAPIRVARSPVASRLEAP